MCPKPSNVHPCFLVGTQKFDFTVDEGKGLLNPSREKKLRQQLLCDPGWCVQNKWDDKIQRENNTLNQNTTQQGLKYW